MIVTRINSDMSWQKSIENILFFHAVDCLQATNNGSTSEFLLFTLCRQISFAGTPRYQKITFLSCAHTGVTNLLRMPGVGIIISSEKTQTRAYERGKDKRRDGGVKIEREETSLLGCERACCQPGALLAQSSRVRERTNANSAKVSWARGCPGQGISCVGVVYHNTQGTSRIMVSPSHATQTTETMKLTVVSNSFHRRAVKSSAKHSGKTVSFTMATEKYGIALGNSYTQSV